MNNCDPIFLVPILTLIGAIICVACAVRTAKWYKRIMLLVVAFVLSIPPAFLVAAVFPELVDARFRTYKRFYRDIQIGMTKAEVGTLIERHYPSGGKRRTPSVVKDSEDRLGYFMNPESSRAPNCEGIFLEIRDGKVVNKSYTPD